MPYPTENPIAKHDIVSPPTISISSGILEPFFDSNPSIIHHLQHTTYDMKKLVLSPVYTYPDAPTSPRPLSRSLYISGFCNLSSISKYNTQFNYEDFIPYNDMSICHLTVKRADVESLEQKQLDNSNKFHSLCDKLRVESKVGIVQCPKTNRVGFFIPMSEYEDGSNYCAYVYIGGRNIVVNMLSATLDSKGNGNSKENDDEVLWKPDKEEGGDDDNNNLWVPPGSNNNHEGDDTMMWQPPTNQNTPFSYYENNTNTSLEINNSFHTDVGAAAADKFYSELTRSLETRSESILYHMRNFNGWVKATQIAELDPKTILSSESSNSKKRKRSRHPLRVLDLACGKGGDLGKWTLHRRGIQLYVGSDVARGSLMDAAIRARNMKKQLKNKCTFICADLGADVPGRRRNSGSHKKMQKLLSWSLEDDNGIGDPVFRNVRGGGIKETDKFDVVSIQFAIHYMMSSEKRARRFFQTVSQLLEIGGNLIATTIDARVVMEHMMDTGLNFHFEDDNDDDDDEPIIIKVGNDACQLKFQRNIVKKIFQKSQISSPDNGNGGSKINTDLFGLEYTFTLVEGKDHAAGVGQAVDLPEWLTPLPVLKQLAEEAGLVMEYASNFHEFYEQRKDPQMYHSAHTALYNMNVLNWNGSISDQEWDISRMYVAIKFRKEKESTMKLDIEDEIDNDETDNDDDDNESEIEHTNADDNKATEEKPLVTDTPSSLIEVDMSDPNVVKMYTKAMAKARISYQGDWKTLTSDERKSLINVELSKMI